VGWGGVGGGSVVEVGVGVGVGVGFDLGLGVGEVGFDRPSFGCLDIDCPYFDFHDSDM